MPILSHFYGITVRMYFQRAEHNPPHVHVIYNDNVAEIEIKSGQVIEGHLPAKALSMACEWINLHQGELLKIWETQEFSQIPPLQ